MTMQDNLQILYGIFDFKRIRTEGYMQCEFGHLNRAEQISEETM